MCFKVNSSTVRFLSVALLLVLMSGVAMAQQVVYNYMPGTDFSKYHTFRWVDIPSNVHPNQIVAQEIRDAVNNVLAAKGFTLATGDKPTLTSVTNVPLTRNGSGAPGAWAVVSAGAAEWEQPRVQRSRMACWQSISTTPLHSN